MTSQRRHIRKSKRGKKFVAGRLKRSKFLRNKIGQELNMHGAYRKNVIHFMEKDPLLFRDYLDRKNPKIKIVPNLLEKEGTLAMAYPDKNEIEVDDDLFKEPLAQSEKLVGGTDVSLNPRISLGHELQHLKYPYLLRSIGEEMAFNRSLIDVRKRLSPKEVQEEEVRKFFKKNLQ